MKKTTIFELNKLVLADLETCKQIVANGHKEDRVSREEQVFKFMLTKTGLYPQKQWYFAYDFIGDQSVGDKTFFFTHRSPARISDLATNYPEVFDKQMLGRYAIYRVKYEYLPENIVSLTSNLQEIYRKYQDESKS